LQTNTDSVSVRCIRATEGGDTIATKDDTKPEELTALQAAEMLGVDKSTVVRWLQNDTLAGWRTIGGHWRVPATEVERVKQSTN